MPPNPFEAAAMMDWGLGAAGAGPVAQIPVVIEPAERNVQAMDIYSRLLVDRIIFIGYPITEYHANALVAQLLFLESDDPDKDIHIYINTPGGSVSGGMAIYDTMQFIKPDVNTYCVGQAASLGALILAAGTKGKRFALPHSRMMIHQPHISEGGLGGPISDIEIHARELLRGKHILNEILAHHTGQTIEQIEKDTDRDYFFGPEEAKEYGLIDAILTSKREKKNQK